MRNSLELAVILTTYERPAHLERSLLSLAMQRDVDGKFEVIVADDGSSDHSQEIVTRFAQTARFPVGWISHPHDGFRVSLCRNDGARATSAPYLLFSDADCIFPANHLSRHLAARRPRVVRAGDCLRLDQDATERIDEAAIIAGDYGRWIARQERTRMFQKMLKEQYYQLVRHPTKPKLTGYNIGISREDLEAVNGFDERFVGWGCEDDDIAIRLRKAGRRIASALRYTHGFHLWHPATPSRPAKWMDGANVGLLQAPNRLIKCQFGLAALPPATNAEPDSEVHFLPNRELCKAQVA